MLRPVKVVLGGGLRRFLNWQGQRREAQVEGTLNVEGLRQPVEVLRDRWGVPHIYARDQHDLFFAQGYVHAQDRLWQMDLNRRMATGRLSEIFGETTLETDRAVRTLGLQRLGVQDLENSPSRVRELMSAYALGVNALIESEREPLPVEFMLLRFQPHTWTPEDTMAFGRLVFWQMGRAWFGELVRAQIIQAVGEERARQLNFGYLSQNPLTLPNGIEFNRVRLPDTQAVPHQRTWGSNAWTVSGDRTETGMPFVCNDMHLPIYVPSIWYQNHLVCDEMNVTGVSMPGIPLVMSGHNTRIAWGLTLAYTDVEDVYVEKFDADFSDRYLYRDKWMQAETITEQILVHGWEQPHYEQVLRTRHGPVISEITGQSDQKLALQSMSLRATRMGEALLALNQAGSWDDFESATRLIDAPQLNIVYGDVDGNIGYRVTGRVPVRARGDGTLPSPGWTGEYEWVGEVPFEEMPHALNPAQGYIVSANHRIVGDEYPYHLGSDFMNGYRARRIVDMLEAANPAGAAHFAAMQMDVTSIPGQAFVQTLQGFETADADAALALELLRAWDGLLNRESIGGTIYEVAIQRLMRSILEPPLGKELTDHVMGLGWSEILYPTHELIGRDKVAVLRLLEDEQSWWLSTAGGRHALLEAVLRDSVQWLRAALGSDPAAWQWGRIHQVEYAHPLSQQEPLDFAFNRGPYPVGGDSDTPHQSGFSAVEPYNNKLGSPSMRFIMDLSDWSRSLAVTPMGQSGQVGTPHYDDLIEMYLEGKYHPMLWEREQVEAELEGHLILMPRKL